MTTFSSLLLIFLRFFSIIAWGVKSVGDQYSPKSPMCMYAYYTNNMEFCGEKQAAYTNYANMKTTDSLCLQPTLKSVTNISNNYFDAFFKIRVNSPKVSSTAFQGYLGDRQKMQLSKIDASLSIINWDDYVTMAVLVDKTGRKKTANGNDFVIWRLCDLQDCQKVVSVFLFGSKCVEDFWKVMPGTVFALLNAVMWTNQQGQKQQNSGITLKIDNSQKILEIGLCPDFAYCQSQRQDGKRCTNVINKSVSSVCDFHILSQSKKFAAKRGEFQLNYSAPPKKFEPKAIPGLYTMAAPKITTSTSKTQSRKPNQASTLLSQVTSNRKANEVLNSVRSQIRSAITESSSESSTTLVIGKSDDIIKTTINESASDNAFVELLGTPSAGSRNLLKQIADQAAKKVANDLRPAIKGDKTLFTKKHCSSLKNAAHKTSQITCQQFLMSHFHKKPTTTMSNKNELAKAKAAAVLRRQSEPNFPLQKSHKFDSETNDIDLVIEGEPAVKKSKLGDLNMSTDDIKKLLLTKSRYDSELGQDDMARQESYFKILECKEKVENRAASIKELPIKVVNCSTCKYTWHSQSDLCKKLNHHLTRHEALRRFFKCKECSKRIICYEKYPNRPCANCSCKEFERTAMKEEKTITSLNEKLKICGDEEPFL